MKRIVPGLLLILIGSYILLTQLFFLPEGFGLLCIGALFLILRGVRGRGAGFTIAGCLLVAVGVASAVDSLDLLYTLGIGFLEGSFTLFLLAISFFTIHIIEHPRIGNWPIIPGICLLAVGGFALLSEIPWLYRQLWDWAYVLWPVALICVGAAILLGNVRRKGVRSRTQEQPEEPNE